MSEGLDVIIVDDDPSVCELIETIVKRFYTWGEVLAFNKTNEATDYCLSREIGVAIFVVDVFLGGVSGFYFLDTIEAKFPTAHSDAIIITGNASDDIVNMCIASDVNHLLEKPVKPYAMQLAVRAIAEKYLKFAKKLFQDPDFAKNVSGI
ncbi:MAG: response regulator [Desulfobacteraceae bacterium]|nr:response regulator [Desulfobacteraceae bacterium]